MRLQNRVAIITGSGTGMGRAAMVLFAREGAMVVGCGRTKATGEETVRLVQDVGGKGRFISGDVRMAADAQRIVQGAVAEFGRLDILINNAGVAWSYPGSMGPLVDTPEEDWDDVVSINLKSVYLMSKFAIPEMRKVGGGAVVNVASIMALAGFTAGHAYTAAKGAVVSLTRAMATTYGPEGIRVNCLVPGTTDTPMIAPVMPLVRSVLDDPRTRHDHASLGRIGTPEEMAFALLYLCSQESSFTNGAVLVVDGGWTAHL